MANIGPPYYYTTQSDKPPYGSPAFPDWDAYVASLEIDPNSPQHARTKTRAEKYAELYYAPAMREIERRRGEALRQYGWSKKEVEPEYQRQAQELKYNLGQQQSQNLLNRQTTELDYSKALRNLAESNKTARQTTAADYLRRGVYRGGTLNKAYQNQDKAYATQMGDVSNTAATRLADITRLGELANQKYGFLLSDAQRARVNQLNKLREGYEGTMSDMALRQQQLAEEQGTRASLTYEDLLDQYMQYAMKARQQGLAESQFHADQYWNQKKFDEDVRRYGLDYALKLKQMENFSRGGGGYGGYGSSSGNGDGKEEEDPVATRVAQLKDEIAYKESPDYTRLIPGYQSGAYDSMMDLLRQELQGYDVSI